MVIRSGRPRLANGRKIRTLTIVDLFTRECLGIEVGFSLRADHVVAAMNRLKYDPGLTFWAVVMLGPEPNQLTAKNWVEPFRWWRK